MSQNGTEDKKCHFVHAASDKINPNISQISEDFERPAVKYAG